MRRTTERTAWAVLWAAFITFCLLLVGLPGAGYWFVQNAMEEQAIAIAAGDGVLVTRPGRSVPEANLESIPPGSVISTGTGDQTTLTFLSPDGRETLASVQLFGDTRVTVATAESPRFQWGVHPHHIQLNIDTGRIQIFSIQGISRPVEIGILSPLNVHSLITTTGTIASVDVSSPQKTITTVLAGQALIAANGGALQLQNGQLAEVGANLTPRLAPTTERDLIVNGDFQQPFTVGWATDIRPPADPNEKPGDVLRIVLEGRRAIQFIRSGSNFGQVGILQQVNRDVRGFKSLRLRLDVFLSVQDLSNCGQYGSECPIMVKIVYTNARGDANEWVQGFYYRSIPGQGLTQCVSCAGPRTEHIQVPQGQWRTYELQDNLLAVLSSITDQVVMIKSITIYASGHTFNSYVAQVQLLASE